MKQLDSTAIRALVTLLSSVPCQLSNFVRGRASRVPGAWSAVR